jgi:hypothetical protein
MEGIEKYHVAARVASQQLQFNDKFPVRRNTGVLPRLTGVPQAKNILTSPPFENRYQHLCTPYCVKAVVQDSPISSTPVMGKSRDSNCLRRTMAR